MKVKVKNNRADKCPFGEDMNSALENFNDAWNKLVAELLKHHNGNTVHTVTSLTVVVSKYTDNTLDMLFGREVK